MEKQPKYSEEEKGVAFRAACDFYASQHCTLESAAKSAGISERTFYLWREQNAELAEYYKKARLSQNEHFWEDIIRPKAERAIQRLITGETKTETKVEEGEGPQGPVSKTVITTSEILPNATVAIFVTKGLNPERFVDKSETKLTGSGENGEIVVFKIPHNDR